MLQDIADMAMFHFFENLRCNSKSNSILTVSA